MTELTVSLSPFDEHALAVLAAEHNARRAVDDDGNFIGPELSAHEYGQLMLRSLIDWYTADVYTIGASAFVVRLEASEFGAIKRLAADNADVAANVERISTGEPVNVASATMCAALAQLQAAGIMSAERVAALQAPAR